MTNLQEDVLSEAARNDSFGRWMDGPEIKLLLSLLPPAQNDTQQDCLKALLQSAFHTGHAIGQGSVAAAMISRLTVPEKGAHD